LSATPNIPEKPFFRVNEVCRLTDTQPYVLRFWESEFPQLAPDHGKGASPVYRKDDVELIFRIKQLLYEEEYTIAGARQILSGEGKRPRAKPHPAPAKNKAGTLETPDNEPIERVPRQLELESARRPTAVQAAEVRPAGNGIAKERYDAAVEEVTHLRLQLTDLENRMRRVEHDRESALEEAERMRDRSDRAIGRLEAILKRLQGA
jgi:DNA-binding transcriptional MerR regulator